MGEPLRLVVAEDDDTDALLIEKNLTRGGVKCTMHRVQTESDFVDALHDVKPDVIISDFSMPQFDGRRALELAVVCAPETPFLFVSGTIGEQRAIDALRCGATDYILKSNMARLPVAVQRAVREAAVKSAQRQSQLQLRSNEEQLRATVETSQDWIWETDTYGRFRFCSPAVAQILGYEPAELIGEDFRLFLSEEEHGRADELLPAAGQTSLIGAVASWRTARGELRWLERNVVAVLDESQRVVGFRGTDRDITQRRDQEARLRRLTRSYRMLSSMGSAILRLRERVELLREVCRIAVDQGGYRRVSIGLIDPNGREVRPQASAGSDAPALLAIDRDDVDPQITSPSMVQRTIRSGVPSLCNDLQATQPAVEHRQLLLDHGYLALAILPVLVDGTAVGVITLFSHQTDVFDETELEVLQELAANLGFALQFLEKDQAVHFLSYFDTITGLAKRLLFCQRLAHTLDASDTEATPSLQVVVFDIQKLGAVNDSFGRYVGDRLVESVAARLKDAYGDPEKLAHLGGGTFAMALPNISNGGDVGPLLQYSIGRLFVEPIHIEGHAICPRMRYGVAIYPDDADSADTLVQYAEAALAAARESNERYLSYPSIPHRLTTRSFALESRLAGALERDEFLLHYQPKLNLTTGVIEGFEALLRWQDTEGLVPPSVFIPLLERSGAIIDVGAWVLLQAAHDIHAWRAAGLADIRVAVNVSPLQLRRRDFTTQVLSCVGSSGGRTGIDIEITESMLMQDIELSTRKLTELRDAGVGVAIDDFGTGYSSLRLLSGLPVTTLKIDRSFVQKGCESQGGLSLVSTIISLARSFRMKTVAEGVETAEQLRMLRGLDCDQAQGFYFARPSPAAQVPELIAHLADASKPG